MKNCYSSIMVQIGSYDYGLDKPMNIYQLPQ